MGYIDRTYIENAISPNQVTALLTYGDGSPVSGSKIDQYINEASDVIDSFLIPAGYVLPLSTTSFAVKQACLNLTLEKLYGFSGQETPDFVKEEIRGTKGWLVALRDKELLINGATFDNTTIQGGSYIYQGPNNGNASLFQYWQLRGKFV